MSRHRHVRNMDLQEAKDEFEGYSSSYEENYSVSPGAAQYLLRRQSFSDDYQGSERQDSSAQSNTPIPTFAEYIKMYKIDRETEVRLKTAVAKVAEFVGSAFKEAEIADALLYYDFDMDKTVIWLTEGKDESAPAPKKNEKKAQPKKTQTPPSNQPKKTAETKSVPLFGFDKPSPDDVVAHARSNKEGPALFGKTPVKKVQPASKDSPKSQLSAGIAASKEPAKAKTGAGAGTGPGAGAGAGADTKGKKPETEPQTSKLPKNTKLTKNKLNHQEEYALRKKNKETLNLVVVGHVDAGKSTLMGHLLYLVGEITQKQMTKQERESQKIGKSSFAFAWALDETDEERKRGITMDVATRKFETATKKVTLLDAPGHRDFIPNMISGAAQADVSILVVDATTGEFEAGFENNGQTKEHSLLVRSLGVSQLIVAVNKLDNAQWSKERFDDIYNKLMPFLKQAGFREKNVHFVPCSGLTGENLLARTAPELSWYSGQTLIASIDSLEPPERAVDKPLRISVSDCFKGGQSTGGGLSVQGRVESGYVCKDDHVVVMPGHHIGLVKNIEVHEAQVNHALAGDNVILSLSNIEREMISNASVLCEGGSLIRVSSLFSAQILVFDVKIPITKGDTVVMHFLSMSEQATIEKLVGILDKSTGELKQKNPRFLPRHSTALVEVRVSNPVCIETYKDSKELGRFTLRHEGKTIASGVIQEIKDEPKK